MRASTPGDVSQISLSAVSLEDTLDDELDLDNTIDDSEIPDELLGGDGENASGLQEPIEGLRRELLLVKFSEFPFGTSESIFHSSVHGNSMVCYSRVLSGAHVDLYGRNHPKFSLLKLPGRSPTQLLMTDTSFST